MNSSIINSIPENEPICEYLPNSDEKNKIKETLKTLSNQIIDIPIIINGKEIRTNKTGQCIMPHNHKHILAEYHKASDKEITEAIQSSLKAAEEWNHTPWEERVKIFKKMAELLKGPYRNIINAATMLSQSKNIFQAEIDSACELIDFFNFNCYYLQKIYDEQPLHSPEGTKNSMQYRPLEGFVFAITPFNFTSIAGNLPTAPALMGNTTIWKPASSSVYSGYYLMKLFKDAGLPNGVINFLPGNGGKIGNQIITNKNLSGIHFTGSTEVFQNIWQQIGNNIKNYKSYPRIVGETGGKDFILAHSSSNKKALITAMIRGAFEYQGQKCSAASRCYIPVDLWENIKDDYIQEVNKIKMGDVKDFRNFMNAVIDQNAFKRISEYIDYAHNSDEAKIITGGKYDDSIGYYITPTTIVTTNPNFKTMEEEIFGPVLTIYPYKQNWDDICNLVDNTSPYALTGAVFAKNKEAIKQASKKLVNSAGNFYINDKPTGAVVGQQPFGGARASGTNDKAGAAANLLRWTSQRTIKENFNPPESYPYPFMEEE